MRQIFPWICVFGLGCEPGKVVPIEEVLQSDGNFEPTHVVQVDIEIDSDDWDILRYESRSFFSEFMGDCMAQPFSNDYTTFPASVSIDGQVQPTVGIRKKGFIGSQSTDKPSLKINIDEYIEGAELFGVDNVTLNNAVQDPSLIRQCLAYGVFAKAGYPASRCNFAHVSVNGQDLGIYVHVEPVKRSFLRDRFGNDDGDLYEGTLSDFRSSYVQTFDVKTLNTDASLQPLRELMEVLAADEVAISALEEHLDIDRFLTFWALETITGHWDGYNGNLNNYYLYRDPSIDKLVFIPWGLDDTMDPEVLESPPFSASVLASKLLQDDEVAALFEERVLALLSTAWNEEELLAEVERIEEMLSAEIDMSPYSDGIEGVRQYIGNRRDILTPLLPGDPEELYPPSCIVEKATMDTQFETQWGTIDYASPFDDGDLNLALVWDGEEVPFSTTGITAGYSEGEPILMMGGAIDADNGAMLLPYISLDIDNIEEEQEILFDDEAVIGGVYYTENSYWGEWIFLGYLVGGNATFELFDTEMGADVKGVLSTSIYIWEAYE